MINTKVLRDWFVIFILLLFLPKENRLAVLDLKPEDWYGELSIPTRDQLIILAKNSKSERVALGLSGAPRITAMQADRKEGIVLGDSTHGLPESLMIIETGKSNGLSARRLAFMNDSYYFEPGALSIFTQSDVYNTYLLVGFLSGGFMFLGFAIARLGFGSDVEPQEK